MPGTFDQKNSENNQKKPRLGKNQGLNYNPDKPKAKPKKNIKHPLMLLRIGFFTCMGMFILLWGLSSQYAAHSIAKKLMRGASFLVMDLGCILLYIWPRYYYEVVNIISLKKFDEDQQEKEVKLIRKYILIFIIFTTIVMIFNMIMA